MATTREKLIDWLAELPDNTDVGIEQERLIVMIDNRAHFFEVGALSDEALESNMEAFLARRKAAMDRLQEIHEESRGEDTDEGAMIVTLEGYICGATNLFTKDANEAFCFRDKAQAELFIADFRDSAPLIGPQVLDHP
jgi:hypothetical protein